MDDRGRLGKLIRHEEIESRAPLFNEVRNLPLQQAEGHSMAGETESCLAYFPVADEQVQIGMNHLMDQGVNHFVNLLWARGRLVVEHDRLARNIIVTEDRIASEIGLCGPVDDPY